MTMPNNRADREFQKFRDTGVTGQTKVAVSLEALAQSASFSTGSHTRPSVSNTSAEVLAANTSRKFAYIFNNTGATVYIKLGATAVVNQGFQIGPNEGFEINLQKLWTGSVTAIKATSTSINLDVFEGT